MSDRPTFQVVINVDQLILIPRELTILQVEKGEGVGKTVKDSFLVEGSHFWSAPLDYGLFDFPMPLNASRALSADVISLGMKISATKRFELRNFSLYLNMNHWTGQKFVFPWGTFRLPATWSFQSSGKRRVWY